MDTNTQGQASHKPMPEQLTYANVLSYGSWSAIVFLIVSYIIYVAGILEPQVPMSVVQLSWGESAHHFVETTGAPSGWAWLGMLNTGDYLNFIGLAVLALLTIVCYLILLPGFIRQKDTIFVVIIILEVVVLSVAASGILGSGGH